VPARCGFKFASTLERVRELNGGRYARGGAGKFITIYPADDDQFRRVAEDLDRATTGLAGPTILSDRQYRPGSLVHYRYGAFLGRQLLTNDGEYLEAIAAPDGTLVEDRREAWFTPPPWATAPFPGPEPPTAEDADGVLLAGRYVVRQAIRHANKGGVFEAVDQMTGMNVIVKQARAHVGEGDGGWEIRDALRNEAHMLDLLAPLGIAPRRIALFEQDGDLFLVQQRIDGVTLAAWCTGAMGDQPGLPWPEAAKMTARLVSILAAVHGLGVVVRDLTPTNLLVRPDGSVTLIDLEFAARAGASAPAIGTPGYVAAEQRKSAAAARTADMYALGALIWLLVTGTDPLLPPDVPAERVVWQRFADWLTSIAETNDAARLAGPLILGLLADAPEDRWSIECVRAYLAGTGTSEGAAAHSRDARRRCDRDRLLADGTDYLLDSMTLESADWLWPASQYGARSDACNVQHGAAGVLATLTWVAGATGQERIRAAIRAACEWIERRLEPSQQALPGLYFGRAGTACALYDAAELLADRGLAARAVALAKRLPLAWPNADVTHGLAGAGYATLHLWLATGDDELRARVRHYGQTLAARVVRRDDMLLWPVPDSFSSGLAGIADYGFAHGTAGIAAFLLNAGRLLDEPGWVALAAEAGQMLCRVAHHDTQGTRWTSGPRDQTNLLEYWCSGSAGIGTYLIRLWQVTGDDRARELAERAAVSVWQRRWLASPAMCHGLAGNGEFLLDLAAATGDERYRRQAEDLATTIAARAALRNGRLLAPDETMLGFGADYGVGVAGWVAYLLRLRHGGPRRWMAER
jgi:hypothetical protein